MRRCQVLLVLGLACLINASSMTLANADDKAVPTPEAKQAREKFAKLLLPNGPQKRAEKPATKHRGVVVNAFTSTHIIIR